MPPAIVQPFLGFAGGAAASPQVRRVAVSGETDGRTH